MPQELELRSFQSEDLGYDAEKGIIKGIAVPYNEITTLDDGSQETFDPDAGVIPELGAILKDDHLGKVGVVNYTEQRPEGLYYEGKLLDTDSGREARKNAEAGIYKGHSVGYVKATAKKIKDAATGVMRVVKAEIPEISLTERPMYKRTPILELRSEQTPPKTGEETMPETLTEDELNTRLENFKTEQDREIEERFNKLEQRSAPKKPAKNPLEGHTAGSFLKEIIGGEHPELIQAVSALEERAYNVNGGKLSDTVVTDYFVGDLTRLVNQNAVLLDFFSKGTLPPTGKKIEYAQLKSETFTTAYGKTAEATDLPYGKIQIETEYADVDKYGGYSELTIDEIERSTVNVLDHNLRGMAIGAGQALNRAMRAELLDLTTNAYDDDNVVTASSIDAYDDILNAAVDAAVMLDTNLGMALDGIVTNASGFKLLQSIKAEDGRPTMLVTGAGNNNIGSVDVKGLTGDIASIPVILDPGMVYNGEPGESGPVDEDPYIAFCNRLALRSYIGPFVRLQDQNIINLTKTFSIYAWAAFAQETPQALIPLQIG